VTPRQQLKRARELIRMGERDLYTAIHAVTETGAQAVELLDLLELQATPAFHAMSIAVRKWAADPTTANGLAAIEACKRPGATLSLDGWLDEEPRPTRREVLQLFDRAILKFQP